LQERNQQLLNRARFEGDSEISMVHAPSHPAGDAG
jgi:hypothetical protein